MKTLIRTIIVILALTIFTAGTVSARNVSDGIVRPAVDVQLQEAETAAVLALAQTNQPAAPVLPSESSPAPSPAPAVAPTPPTLPTSTGVEDLSRRLDSLRALSFGSRTDSSDIVLVIPTEQTSTEDLIAINEDMNVMSRIFETNLEQDRIATARSGIFISSRRDSYGMFLGGSRGQIQSMYLQGYGALFLLKVDFPLSPSSDVQEEEKETPKEEKGDPVWEQMKRDMYEPENVKRRRRPEKPEEKYDPERVENLKTTLIKTLKHAVNIRNLKPDESVVLTVTGSGEITGAKIVATSVSGNGQQLIVQEKSADGKTTMRIVNGKALDDIGLSSPTVLVIRVKRSEIDAFAKGELDFDKFRARVQVITYPLLSKEVGSSSSRNIGLYDDFVR